MMTREAKLLPFFHASKAYKEGNILVKFETRRLSARTPGQEDTARITELMQERDISWMLGRVPWPYSYEDAENWLGVLVQAQTQGTEYAFALHHPEHGLIGVTGMFHVQDDIWEIGYWIGKPYWGQGYVTEAARGLMDWAERELGVTRFVSGHIVDNPASGRVLEKLGFKLASEIEMYVKGRDCIVRSPRYILKAPVDVALKDPLATHRPQKDTGE